MVRWIFGLLSIIAFIFDFSHIVDIVQNFNSRLASGTTTYELYHNDLTNSLLLIIPIALVLIWVFKPPKA